jgi:hypothetical protein
VKKVLLALAFISITSQSHSEDFEKVQNNFRVRTGDYGLEIREEINSNKDHLQLSYFGIKDAEIRLRYVDNLTAKEWRPQISYFVYRGDNFFIRPRLDYRHFIGNNSDYFSFRSSIGAKFKLNQNYELWSEVNPIWDFGIDKTSDLQLDKAQFRVGFDYFIQNLRIGPFIQYETTGNFVHTDTFLGTTVLLTY